jgi:hypothetical protein
MKAICRAILYLLVFGIVVEGIAAYIISAMESTKGWYLAIAIFVWSITPYIVLAFANKHVPDFLISRIILLATTLIVTLGGITMTVFIVLNTDFYPWGPVSLLFLTMYQNIAACIRIVIMWVVTQIAK